MIIHGRKRAIPRNWFEAYIAWLFHDNGEDMFLLFDKSSHLILGIVRGSGTEIG